MALSALEGLDPKVALSLVSTLSEEMKQNATVQAILPTLEARARTSIGDMFTDFEVVQDPADPHSAVKLSLCRQRKDHPAGILGLLVRRKPERNAGTEEHL